MSSSIKKNINQPSQESFIQRCPHDHENPYTMVRNDLIRDKSISPECRWLLIYLLSNDPDWKISVKQVCNHLAGQMGRDRVYAMFDEAIEAGYMKKVIIRKANLRQHAEYYISEHPKFKKCFRHPEFQYTEIRDTENQDDKEATKEEYSLKKESDKEKRNPPAFNPLSFTNEDVEGIRIFCASRDLEIEDKQIRTWLRKFGVERVIANLVLLLNRKTKFSYKLMETALKQDFAAEPKRIHDNRNFALKFKKTNHWSSLTITKQYCRCENTNDDLKFNLHSSIFQEILIKIYKKQKENF